MLYQFDMGEGKSRYYYGDRSPVYTYHGPNAYYLRHEAPPTPPVLRQWEVEPCDNIGIAMEFYAAAIIIKCDGKFGVLLRDKCLGGMGDGGRYGASSFPCVYDNVRLPDRFSGARLFKRGDVLCGFISVCKGGKWANLLLSEGPLGGKVTSKLANQFVFDTAEEAEKWMEENKETVDISFASLFPRSKPVRFLMVADIHTSGTDGLDPAECDAAIVAGDFIADTPRLPDHEYRKALKNDPFFAWCGKNPDLPVFLIPGNHDHVAESHPDWIEWPGNIVRLLDGEGIEENGVGLAADGAFEFKGLKLWGIPWSSSYSRRSGFLCPDDELLKKFDAMPSNLDVLVLHGPPMFDGSESAPDKEAGRTDAHFGNATIRAAVLAKKPRLAVCGHIHQGAHEPTKLGETIVVNVGRVEHKHDRTPSYSPAYVAFNPDGTIDVTPAKRL